MRTIGRWRTAPLKRSLSKSPKKPSSSWRRRLKPASVYIASLTLLSACAPSTAPRIDLTPEKLCSQWQQIKVRPADRFTEPTAKEILANNEAREAIGCVYEKPTTAIKALS